MGITDKIETRHKWHNRCDPETGKHYKPEAVVLHITDGSFASTKAWIQDPRSNVSYNWIINDGEVYECVNEKDSAWSNGHVVRPTWKGIKVEDNEIVNPNLYTISVAVVNSGQLPTWRTWKAWVQLNKEIRLRNNWDISPDRCVNHFEIKSSKSCPRPYFSRFYLKLLTDIIK